MSSEGCYYCGVHSHAESCHLSQKAEIDRLGAEVTAVRGILDSTVDTLTKTAAENAELRAALETIASSSYLAAAEIAQRALGH